MMRVRVEPGREGAAVADVPREAEVGRAACWDDGLILNLGGMCMLYNHIQNTHSILYLFGFL